MIRVKKIAHASYDVPDLEQQTDYYTNILGMTVAAKEKDAAFLANTVDHHSVVLRKGTQAGCVRVGFQLGEGDDLDAFEKQVQAHGIKTAAQEGSRALDLGAGHLRGPEGHGDGGVQARRFLAPEISRPRASCRTSSATSPSTSPTSSTPRNSIATCSAFANPTGWATSSRSCAAGPTTTPST